MDFSPRSAILSRAIERAGFQPRRKTAWKPLFVSPPRAARRVTDCAGRETVEKLDGASDGGVKTPALPCSW